MKKSISILLIGLFVSSCTGIGASRQPIVDIQGSPAVQQGRNYNEDLNYCRGLATQASPVESGLVQGLGGAAVGAAAGAAIGAITGNPGQGAAIGAAGGGIFGTARGAQGGVEEQERIVSNCMRGRGWNVVN